MIPSQLSTNHLNRLFSFLHDNMPLPQQSYKETKLLLKQLIKNLNKEIRVNLIDLDPEQAERYHDGAYALMSEASFINYDRLYYFEFMKPPATAAHLKMLEELRQKGFSLALLKDPNPFFRKKKTDLFLRLLDLFEEECRASPKIWREF